MLNSPLQGIRLAVLRRRVGRELRSGAWSRIEDLLRYVAAGLFSLIVFFCVIGIPAILVLTSTFGFGDMVRAKVEEKLGGRFYRVSLRKVLFNPTRGFILEGLSIRDTTPSARLVLSTDRVSVSFNMESLMKRKIRLERISLRDATLDIPLGQSEEPRLRLDHVRALILCPPEQFRLTEASFEVAGITVRASGTFLNPKQFSPKAVSSEGPGNTARTIDAIQKDLKKVAWGADRPVLTIEAGGDLADTESLRVDHAEFRAGGAEFRGVRLERIILDLKYASRLLTLEKLLLDDGMGVLQAVGNADFGKNHAELEVAGAFNAGAIPLLLSGKEKSREWVWTDPLRVNGAFAVTWGNGPATTEGRAMIESGRFRYRGVSFDSVSGGVALREGKVLVRDFHIEGDPGSLDADVMVAPGDNRLRLKASLYPGKLAPAASGKLAETLSTMDFRDPLVIQFSGESAGKDPLAIRGKGTLNLGKAAMRGAWIDSLASTLQVDSGAASFRDIVVRIGEGTGKGEFVYDFKNWEGRLPGVRSTLDPVKVMTWIDPRIAYAIKDYRFNRPPELQVSGKVGLRNPDKNDLRIGVNATAGLRYTLIGRELPFTNAVGNVRVRGQELFVDISKAYLFGGTVSLKADVPLAQGSTGFGASVHVEEVDLETLTKLYFDYNESTGRLTADYAFRAVNGNDRAMTGKGNMLIKDGNVLGMPILGPLSVLLNEAVPGLGYQSARRATADFTVDDGAISTRNILIQGSGFNMIGNGKIFYLDNQMSMNMRLNMQGLPGIVLFPVSKIFEYESVGSATHPKWRPKILPKFGAKEGSVPQASPSPSPGASPKQSGQ